MIVKDQEKREIHSETHCFTVKSHSIDEERDT
jgi:hypothetical protein